MHKIDKLAFATLIACLIAFTATPVSADWQFTRWGMSADDTIAAAAASGFTARRLDNNTVAIGEYPFASFSFEVVMDFETGSLGGLSLCLAPRPDLAEPERAALLAALVQQLGAPAGVDYRAMRDFYFWRTGHDIVTLSLSYQASSTCITHAPALHGHDKPD